MNNLYRRADITNNDGYQLALKRYRDSIEDNHKAMDRLFDDLFGAEKRQREEAIKQSLKITETLRNML